MSPGAEIYGWLNKPPYQDLVEYGYCITTVAGLGALDLIRELDATPTGQARGFDELSRLSYERWGVVGAGRELVAGFRDTEAGSIMVEINGYAGVSDGVMQPVSVGREVVAHFSNVNAYDRFLWWKDGEVLLDWEPGIAHFVRSPSAEIRAMIVESGIPLDDADRADFAWSHLRPRVFALAERLSGTRVTPELLEADFLTADVTIPA